MKSVDKRSLAIGILLALLAQGLYDAVFYGIQGKTYEEWAAVGASVITFGLLFVMLYYQGYLKSKSASQDQAH